jgi:enoyl-CoA hydratase
MEFVKIEKGLGPEGRIAAARFDRGDGINALSPEAAPAHQCRTQF